MSSRKGGRWSPASKSKISPKTSPKLSSRSFKGRFSSSYGSRKSGSTTSSETGDASSSSSTPTPSSTSTMASVSSSSAFSMPMISLTSSTGSSSCLLSSQEEDSTSDHSSRSSGLNRIASRASDIQSYASRYLDSIRTKSWTTKSRSSPARSESPHSGIPYLLTFRQHQQFSPIPGAASNLQALRPHSVSPSTTPPLSSSLSPSRKTSDSRSAEVISGAIRFHRFFLWGGGAWGKIKIKVSPRKSLFGHFDPYPYMNQTSIL